MATPLDEMSDLEKLESGLLELDPSPIDSPELPSTPGKDFPTRRSTTTNSLGLNTSTTHSAIWYLARLHKYSSYAFSAFATMHIANTSFIPLLTQSVPASEPYLLLTRPYYQGFPMEPLLVTIPIYTHVLSGLAIRVLRRNQNAARYGDAHSTENKAVFFTHFWPKVSGIAKLGYPLAVLVTGHMAINRWIPRKHLGGSVELAYVSHAFARHPVVAYSGFAALMSVGVFHVTWGWAKWLGWTPGQVVTQTGYEKEVARKRRWYAVNGVAAGVLAVWMAGAFGVVARGGEALGWVGRQYDEIYGKIPVVGRWL
ncbi:N2,N2-dimethylguanosine tRNA methyltransferase like protein [Zymoseptoria brevis]|uniref:N2,N2-dimethylguanosine tRNA methyltransferase like protein n=1 Tax=Zymoseptoria brevis TaxID=1047168 RepID=A0A0F4GKN6_9PEZI|nr:N2,N2-dimethylguanosine tRNA methyltransferase like protein [Zymoseptoria brevis]